jgi:hypothetical protein
MTNVPAKIVLKARDRATLRVLSYTTATAPLIFKASQTFLLPEGEEPYRDERRVRERLQTLKNAKLVRTDQVAGSAGALVNYYRLTHEGYRTIEETGSRFPAKSFFEPLAMSRVQHTMRLAEVIVHTLFAAHRHRITLSQFMRENELQIKDGPQVQSPDAHFQLRASGRTFNLMFEIDNSTEPLEGDATHAIVKKLQAYEAHQDCVLRWWLGNGRPRRLNPRFRAVFLTKSAERAEHIAALAAETARNKDRLVCYVATQDTFLTEPAALTSPIFFDHHGRWQSLVNLHPSSHTKRTPIRLEVF